jgi:hypothetical protein
MSEYVSKWIIPCFIGLVITQPVLWVQYVTNYTHLQMYVLWLCTSSTQQSADELSYRAWSDSELILIQWMFTDRWYGYFQRVSAILEVSICIQHTQKHRRSLNPRFRTSNHTRLEASYTHYYYYYYYYYYYLSPLCRAFTFMYLKQAMLLGHTVLQLFCIYTLCCM